MWLALTLSIILNLYLLTRIIRLRKHDPERRNIIVDTIIQLLENSNPNNWEWYTSINDKQLVRIEHKKQQLVIRLRKRDCDDWITPYSITSQKDLNRIFEAVKKLVARRIADKDSCLNYNPTLHIAMPSYMGDPLYIEQEATPTKPPKIQPQIIPEGSSKPLTGQELEQHMKRTKNG